MQGVWVQSVGGELGSHTLHGLSPAKKKKKDQVFSLPCPLYNIAVCSQECWIAQHIPRTQRGRSDVHELLPLCQLKLSSSRSSMQSLSHRGQADQLWGFLTYKKTRLRHSVMEAFPSMAWENLCWKYHLQDLVVFTGAQSISKSRVETRSLESQHLTRANTTMTWLLSAGPDSGETNRQK